MDLFRFRCYLASLQGGELPNPKRLLAFASRPTKLAMGRLGIFSVSSFHALVNITTLFLRVLLNAHIQSGLMKHCYDMVLCNMLGLLRAFTNVTRNHEYLRDQCLAEVYFSNTKCSCCSDQTRNISVVG